MVATKTTKTTKTTRNPGFASGKSNKPLSLESIKVQYGNPNSEEGRSGTAGRLYIFVKSLGDDYVKNMAKVLEPGFLLAQPLISWEAKFERPRRLKIRLLQKGNLSMTQLECSQVIAILL